MSVPAVFQPEPSVAGAIRRYKILFLAVLVVCIGGGTGYAELHPKTYAGTASVSIPSPPAQSLGTTANPTQYQADQLTLLQSPKVVDQAARMLGRSFPKTRPTGAELLAGLTVTPPAAPASVATGLGSADALVRTTLATPELAAAAANAVVEAYKVVRAQGINAEASSALANLDGSIGRDRSQLDAVNHQLTGVDQQIAALQAQQQQANQTRINEGLRPLPSGPTPPNAAQQQLQTQQSSLDDQLASLTKTRDQLQVDEQAALAAPVDVIPALPVGTPDSPSPLKYGGLGAIVGVILGAALAYLLAVLRPRFNDRTQPELVLDAPLLGDVPDFRHEKIPSVLPVRSWSPSGAAEAFRYVGASLRALAEGDGPMVFLVTSATLGDGKTTVAANTAVALSESGASVLAVDADFVRPRLAALLLDGKEPARGLADVLRNGRRLESVVEAAPGPPGHRLDVLGGGLDGVRLSGTSPATLRDLFAQAGGLYDFVVVDGPPMLAAAFAADLLSQAANAVVVVDHSSFVRTQRELLAQIRTSRARLLGYVYNRAPLRRELVSYYSRPGPPTPARVSGRPSDPAPDGPGEASSPSGRPGAGSVPTSLGARVPPGAE